MLYYQCHLLQTNAEHPMRTIGWIEARGAKFGNRVELKDFDNQLFTVLEVYRPGIDAGDLKAKQDRDRNAFASIR